MAFVKATARAVRTFGQVYERKWTFLAAFLLIFFFSFSVLTTFDIVPEPVVAEKVEQESLTASVGETLAKKSELPVRIEISAINLDATIANPVKTDVATLDEALLDSAVRFPTSAKLGEHGNLIVFGHSSYLPVVNNEAFKIFNQIQDLKKGDRITVYGKDTAYVYEVDTVSQEDANSAAIPLTVSEPTLTLATCDSFGKKSDRFVVVAKLVGSHPVETN